MIYDHRTVVKVCVYDTPVYGQKLSRDTPVDPLLHLCVIGDQRVQYNIELFVGDSMMSDTVPIHLGLARII